MDNYNPDITSYNCVLYIPLCTLNNKRFFIAPNDDESLSETNS